MSLPGGQGSLNEPSCIPMGHFVVKQKVWCLDSSGSNPFIRVWCWEVLIWHVCRHCPWMLDPTAVDAARAYNTPPHPLPRFFSL
jgi:hypothetical protein